VGIVVEGLGILHLPMERTPTIMILSKSDPFIRDLRKLFAKTKSVHGIRLGGQLYRDRFIQDAYLHMNSKGPLSETRPRNEDFG
jgi:hypothetical protein